MRQMDCKHSNNPKPSTVEYAAFNGDDDLAGEGLLAPATRVVSRCAWADDRACHVGS